MKVYFLFETVHNTVLILSIILLPMGTLNTCLYDSNFSPHSQNYSIHMKCYLKRCIYTTVRPNTEIPKLIILSVLIASDRMLLEIVVAIQTVWERH